MSGKGAKGLSGKGAKGTIGGEKKGDKKKPISRSARAGLQFPVGRIHRLLKVSRRRGRLWALCLGGLSNRTSAGQMRALGHRCGTLLRGGLQQSTSASQRPRCSWQLAALSLVVARDSPFLD